MLDSIISLLAGIGAFMIGFKIMSESIEKTSNKGLKKIFFNKKNNAFVGVGVGLAATALIQSSSATTVMVVGFVNAGVMNLFQATAIIMGANIGTTITAQIVALQSFDFGLFAMLFAFIGIFMNLLFKDDRLKTIGYALAGVGLLFLGLRFMSDAMSVVKENQAVVDVFSKISNPFLLLAIGMVTTALVQSSSTVTTIIISMAAAGITIGSGGNSVLYVILGTNIGTCVTALLSSIGAGANAKRASIIHLMFNVFGSLIFLILLLCWKDFMVDTFASWFKAPTTQIAMFHTFFNILSTLIFLPFINLFVKTANFIVKDKKNEKKKLIFMDKRMLQTPSIALAQLANEVSYMLDESFKILKISFDGFMNKDVVSRDIVVKKNDKLEKMSSEITEYLVEISSADVSVREEKTISQFHRNLADILRIGELGDNITKYTSAVVNNKLEFSDQVITEFGKLYETIEGLYQMVSKQFNNHHANVLADINIQEDKIDDMRRELVEGHLARLKEGTCQPQSSGVFINLVNNLERAADHLTYIVEIQK